MPSIASEHAGEAADTLRSAAQIEDPYLRANAIWEAMLRVRSAADHLRGRAASLCTDIARYLEEGCEVAGEPLAADTLRGYAETLEGLSQTPATGKSGPQTQSSFSARSTSQEERNHDRHTHL
jgi:hypothetical protein